MNSCHLKCIQTCECLFVNKLYRPQITCFSLVICHSFASCLYFSCLIKMKEAVCCSVPEWWTGVPTCFIKHKTKSLLKTFKCFLIICDASIKPFKAYFSENESRSRCQKIWVFGMMSFIAIPPPPPLLLDPAHCWLINVAFYVMLT